MKSEVFQKLKSHVDKNGITIATIGDIVWNDVGWTTKQKLQASRFRPGLITKLKKYLQDKTYYGTLVQLNPHIRVAITQLVIQGMSTQQAYKYLIDALIKKVGAE